MLALCLKENKTVLKYSRVHEVFPKNVVHRETIEVKPLTGSAESSNIEVTKVDDGGGSNLLTCSIRPISDPQDPSLSGYCMTWVAGPNLYSISGLKTAFGLSGPPNTSQYSAVYISSFADLAYCPAGTEESCDHHTPQWANSGKVVVPTIVSKFTGLLSGNSYVRIFFNVRYNYYIYWVCDSFAGACMKGWYLEPVTVGGVQRADELGLSNVRPYSPSTHPPYAYGPNIGNAYVWFKPVSQSDSIVTSITITFGFPLEGWTALLSVSYYKAGRDDNQYIPPLIHIVDVSDRAAVWYYYWFRDNNSMTYEALFSPT